MLGFEQELDHLRAIVESTESFQLKLDVEKVEDMAMQLYYHNPDSARVVEHLSFENPPFVNLIDRRKKDVKDRKAIWENMSDVYLGRIVAVNIPSSDSDYDYDNHLASLSTDARTKASSVPPSTMNRPDLTPSLGSITVWVTYVVWDDVSLAFSVEYDGSIEGKAETS